MQPQMIISLATGLVKAITMTQLPAFCTFLLQNASLKVYTLNESLILSQCFSSYFAYFKYLEFKLIKEISVDFILTESAFLMPILLDGKSTLYDQAGVVVSETRGNSCSLIHLTAGNYRAVFKDGKHKLLLLTFRAEWFMSRNKHLAELALLADNYISEKQPHLILPHCASAAELFKKFELAKYEIDVNHCSRNDAAYKFVDSCINRYNKQLLAGKFNLSSMQKLKVLEITNYIALNIENEVLNNSVSLATKFNLSERTMHRYFKDILKLSACKYVLQVRMHKAMDRLKTTNIAIKEVAASVGYPNSHYFSQAFKGFYGFSPKTVSRLS